MNAEKICPVCGQPLAVSCTRMGLKSCPHCSESEAQHVFYAPLIFGSSGKRITKNWPAGTQSWCTICRGGAGGAVYPGGLTCSDVAEQERNRQKKGGPDHGPET